MFKHSDNPKYHIVSVRVSEEDHENLNMLCRQSQKTISDLMREALQIWIPVNCQPQRTKSWRPLK
ncbi:ribbon-helix-helix protein, CopG family [Geomonas azotofigens]|uniref:ribbon-helix-helix protein, CopG family n=1 Tax=Geomonas azotofigens TaxID=2843196 RepID=UPI001C11C61E|nr:ribbon-helix-helix protein, CopG family [Geomonas azotofigens]MBU5614475.1 ribbon-helix-helix protein, CopG family [Geomonas azotofigens]